VQTPRGVPAGNGEIPHSISEELSKLVPELQLISEWKADATLTSAKVRVKEFLTTHTRSRA